MIFWETLENHTVDFRASAAYQNGAAFKPVLLPRRPPWSTLRCWQSRRERLPEMQKPGVWLRCAGLANLVARGGIEPPTQGFSILCSTD